MKTALITGSNSGIGLELVRAFADKGYLVYGNYRSSDSGLNELQKKNHNIRTVKADVRDIGGIHDMFKEINETEGKLDCLINNAGIENIARITDADLNEWEDVLRVNLMGKMCCIRYAIPLLRKGENPSIINIASRLASKPVEGSSAYCCSMAGTKMLTRVAAVELAEYGIRVNSISPGLCRTPMTERFMGEDEFLHEEGQNPLNRLCSTEDIANAALFLASDDSKYINGEDILITGGSHCL